MEIDKTRPGHLVTEVLGHVTAPDDGDNDSFASADDIGVLNVAFDDAIDNLTRFDNITTLQCLQYAFAALPMTTSPTDQ